MDQTLDAVEAAPLTEDARAQLEEELAFYQTCLEDYPGNLLAMEGVAHSLARLGATWRAAKIFWRLAQIYASRGCEEQRRAAEEMLRRL